MPRSVVITGIVSAVLGFLFLLSAVAGVKRRHLSGVPGNLLWAVVLGLVSALIGMIVVSTRGYRALTHEEVAAVIRTAPLGPGAFRAELTFPDGRTASFNLAGDQLYVDAHILKWKTIANLLGLHTAYELDRVAGRFSGLDEEKARARTVFSVGRSKPLDMFSLRQRYALLEPLVDVEYGSATFIAANRVAQFELRVSTTGLLIREVATKRTRSATSALTTFLQTRERGGLTRVCASR